MSIGASLPEGDALLWSDGRFSVGHLVESDGDRAVFMDSFGERILDWPSHWMPLPDGPAD